MDNYGLFVEMQTSLREGQDRRAEELQNNYDEIQKELQEVQRRIADLLCVEDPS